MGFTPGRCGEQREPRGLSVDTHVAASPVVAARSVSLDLGVVASPSRELEVGRWPCWARLMILVGASGALWVALGWLAFRVLKLG